jgi:DNA-binding transcriptional ArsR family regulator
MTPILNRMVQYAAALDSTFAAVADPVRRGILTLLGRRDASITELADSFGMTLTGVKKHVAILEQTRLVTTKKEGRVRTCRIGPRKLEREAEWIAGFQQMIDARFDRLEALLERLPEK